MSIYNYESRYIIMKVDVKSPNIIETTYIKYALPVFQKPYALHRVL